MQQTLGVSIPRRIVADLLDTTLTIAIAMSLQSIQMSPWLAVTYFLIRDLPPINRSVGKVLTGVKIYDQERFAPPSFKQLLRRGLANLIIVIPLAILLATFFVFSFVGIATYGLLVYFYGGDSWILRGVGYDFVNGQTLADRLAKTHLIQPRDLESLTKMTQKIEQLRASIKNEEAQQ
jgi:hypothetical protein